MASILENTHLDLTQCASCGTVASMRCAGCIDSPEYKSGESVGVVYCNHDCQKAHWPKHKTQCNVRQKRKKLLRIAMLMKTTLLAYRECAFDIDIERIEFREGILRLQERLPRNPNRPHHTEFLKHLTTNIKYKEAALANNQCTLAMALLGPLARHLLAGVSLAWYRQTFSVGKPKFSTKHVLGPSNPPSYVLEHTVLVLELENNKIYNEIWIIDAAGCQFGFQDVLIPVDEYFEENACRDLKQSRPYDATETKDIDFFLTLPFMNATARSRKGKINERAARLHFAAFVKGRIGGGGEGFRRDMLLGSAQDFQANLDAFTRELKVHMMEFV